MTKPQRSPLSHTPTVRPSSTSTLMDSPAPTVLDCHRPRRNPTHPAWEQPRSLHARDWLNPRTGGGKRGVAARLHAQMERLFRSTISFEDQRPTHKTWVDMRVAPRAMLWRDTSRSQQDCWLWDQGSGMTIKQSSGLIHPKKHLRRRQRQQQRRPRPGKSSGSAYKGIDLQARHASQSVNVTAEKMVA